MERFPASPFWRYLGLSALLVALTQQSVMSDAPSQQQILKYVRLLGSPKFSIREDATQELLGRGGAALSALQQASNSGDREIRDRSRRIIALIHVRRRADQLEAFKTGRSLDGELSDLPGWELFCRNYGQDRESRQVFAEMLESEWGLLQAIYGHQDSSPSVRRLLAERLDHLQRQGHRKYSMGTMLSIFVIATDFPDEVPIHQQLYQFCVRHTELRAALNPAAQRHVVRKIVGAWTAAASRSALHAHACLLTAMKFQLPDGVVAAERALENDAATPQTKSIAMQVLAKFGDRPQARILEALLEDTTPLPGGGRQRQLRDIALACLMYMHGYDVSKIGVRLAADSMHEPTRLFDHSSLGFDSDADRHQAMETWLALKTGSGSE